MRIVFFSETFLPKVDGITNVLCLFFDHLAERGIESMIVAPNMKHLGPVPKTYNKTRVYTPVSIPFPIYDELTLGMPTVPLLWTMHRYKPDLVHLIHPACIGTTGLVFARLLGLPVLTSFHLDMAAMARHLNAHYLVPLADFGLWMHFRTADYTLAPSKPVQERLLKLGVQRVGLWGRGVDSERFNPKHYSDEMRHRLSDNHPEDTLLLYVGRLSTEKRITDLRAVLERVPNTRLAIIGDGPERANLEAYFSGTPTRFMGYLTGLELSQAYASADIFTFPSGLESFGLVIVEAMAAGLPVVASRVGGVMETVQEDVTGCTFEIGDCDGLVEGVRKIASSREKIKTMGKAARAFAETRSWPAMNDEIIQIYEQVINEHRSKRRRRDAVVKPGDFV